MSLRLSHDETTRSTPVLSNNSKCLQDSSDSKATCGSVRNQELPLLLGAPAAKVANQWHHHRHCKNPDVCQKSFCQQDFPLYAMWVATEVPGTQPGTAQGGCSGTVGHVLPHCTSAGPSALGGVPYICPGCPWLVTAPAHRLHGDTAALLKIHTHIHMHPYVKKEEFVIQ